MYNSVIQSSLLIIMVSITDITTMINLRFIGFFEDNIVPSSIFNLNLLLQIPLPLLKMQTFIIVYNIAFILAK